MTCYDLLMNFQGRVLQYSERLPQYQMVWSIIIMIMSGTPGLAANDKVALSAKGPAQCVICMKLSLPSFSQKRCSKIFKDFKACAALRYIPKLKLVFGGGQHILSAKVRGRKRSRCLFLPKHCSFRRYDQLLASNLSSCPMFVCSAAATCGGNAKSAAPALHTNNHLLC